MIRLPFITPLERKVGRTLMQSQIDGATWKASVAFFCKAIIWGVIIFFTARAFAVKDFWVVPAAIFLLSVPIFLCGIYAHTIRKIHQITIFAKQGWLYRLFFGRFLKTVFWILWSLGMSFFMLVQFHTYNSLDWLIFFLVIPVFWFVFTLFCRLFGHELKPYIVTNMAMTWARWCSSLLMLVIYLFFIGNYGEMPAYSSINEAINAQKIIVSDMTGSALVLEVSQYLAIYDGIKAYAFWHLGNQELFLALALLSIGSFVVFYNACTMLSCFLIPGREYFRIFIPLNDADKPDRPSNAIIAQFVAVFTFIIFFIYIPFFAYFEALAQQTPAVTTIRNSTEKHVEEIGGLFFKVGTIALLQDARIKALHNAELSLVYLESQADRAFDQLEGNVDSYLNWYYSLGGEYARIGNLMVGNLDQYMIKKLESSLQQGDVFKDVQMAFNKTMVSHKVAMSEYQQLANKIMNQNHVESVDTSVQVVQQLSLESVLNPSKNKEFVGLRNRLGGGAVIGGISAVVITKIIGKIAGKGAFKLAVKGLTKLVVSKAAGAAGGVGAGAVAGAAAGSVIPGLGTAVGAVVGGVIGGIAVGLAVDKALIEFESFLNREEFKRAILSAIEEARIEFKSNLKREF